jgi:hypothetical protein
MATIESEEEVELSQTQRTEPEEAPTPRVTKRRKLDSGASTARSDSRPPSPRTLHITTPPATLRSERWFFGSPALGTPELNSPIAASTPTEIPRISDAAANAPPPVLDSENQRDGELANLGEFQSILRDLATAHDAYEFATKLGEDSTLLRGDAVAPNGWGLDGDSTPYLRLRMPFAKLIPPHAVEPRGYKRPFSRVLEGSATIVFRPASTAPSSTTTTPPPPPPPPPPAQPPREPDREGEPRRSRFRPVTRANAQAGPSTGASTNMGPTTRSKTHAMARANAEIVAPVPRRAMTGPYRRMEDLNEEEMRQLELDIFGSRLSSTEAVVGTTFNADAPAIPGLDVFGGKHTYIVHSRLDIDRVVLAVAARSNVEQLQRDLAEETRTHQGPFWDVRYATGPEIRGTVPSTTTAAEDVRDIGKYLDRLRAVQYLQFVLDHAGDDVQRMQVDKDVTDCKYMIFSDAMSSGLTICLAPEAPATLVMALPHKHRLHSYDQNPSIATMTGAQAGKLRVLESIPMGSNGYPRLTAELTRNAALARTGGNIVYDDGLIRVTAGYVDREGNFRDRLDAGDVDGLSDVEVDELVDDIEDDGVVNMTVDRLDNSVGGPVRVRFDDLVEEIFDGAANDARVDDEEAAPWNADGDIDYARVQALLERSQCVPTPSLMQVLSNIDTPMSSAAIEQQERERRREIVDYDDEDTTRRLAVIREENEERYQRDTAARSPSPGRVQDITNMIRYVFTMPISNAIILNHRPSRRALNARQTPPHMDAPIDPRLQPPTPAPTDSSYPSTATLASSTYYTAPTTQATSAVPSSAHSSMPSLVSYHSASAASSVRQLPTPDPEPEDEDTVLIFSGNDLHYEQLTMRLARIERRLSEMEIMHQSTRRDLGHAAATNQQNLLEVRDGMYDMLAQVSTSVDAIYEYLTHTGQFRDEVNTSFDEEAHHLDYHVEDVMQETHDLRHFIEDALRPLTHNVHHLQWTLDHRIDTMHGQYGDLAERVEEHYHDNRSDLQEILRRVQRAIGTCGRWFRGLFRN